jgi:acetyl esterase/lipase
MMNNPLLYVTLAMGLALTLPAQTSADTPRLKEVLKRFPEADADQDGVLTLAEAKAFKDKRTGQGDPQRAKSAGTPEGGERHVYKDVGGAKLPLYVYRPAGHKAAAKVPAIVFFFGGGWKSGSPSQFEPQCKALASRGMVAVTVEYRVASRYPVKVKDCVEDAKSAMRWVRGHAAELGVDPDRIAAGGGSAGGHLAASVAVIDDFNAATDDAEASAKPNAMVLFNPALALARDERLSDAYLARITAGGAERAGVQPERISPLTYAATKQAPCIMFFGTADPLLEGAELYRKDSEKAGNDCRIVTYEGQGHGFFNRGRYFDLTLAEMDKFLVSLGWLAPK